MDRRIEKNLRLRAANALSSWLSTPRETRAWINKYIDRMGEGLSTQDRALLHEMVLGSVRWLNLLEHVVQKRLKGGKRPAPPLMPFFLLGAYQILFLHSVPPYAAVNETVEALKATKFKRASGFLNAVLRRILKEREDILGTEIKALPLYLRCAHPKWMVELLSRELGKDVAETVISANNEPPPLSLRVNRLRTNRDEFLALLESHGISARAGRFSPWCVVMDKRQDPVRIPGYDEGLFSVQDEASQLVTMLLDPRPGERILDACAGVGGKTTHIAELLGGKGEVVALEPSAHRRRLMIENLERLGVNGWCTVPGNGDALRAKDFVQGTFHRIIVDAPCSGLGVIRRHPDIKWNRREGDICRLAQKQLALLESVSELVGPGGRLVYSLCTYVKEETEGVVRAFLERHPDFHLVDPRKILPVKLHVFLMKNVFFRILPPETDGFFGAVLEKIGPSVA